MQRWIAIGRLARWADLASFGQDLKATQQWRPTARTSITEVVFLEDGRFIAECHAPDREAFESWLAQHGCEVESVTRIAHLARTGEIWKA